MAFGGTGEMAAEWSRQRLRYFPVRRAAAPVLVAALLSLVPAVDAAAAEGDPMTFLGNQVKSHEADYVVLKDVNVRARPETKSKKVGSFKKGRRIKVVAKAKGAWVAVRKDGKDLGFVYEPILLPLIDGTLTEDISGRVAAEKGPKCDYRIHFDGKSPVEGQLFEIADYDVIWDCQVGKRKVSFLTPMFITEAPYQLSQKRIYQISIDVLDLYGGYDDIFSTVVLYNQGKDRVVFDGVSIEKYGKIPGVTKKAAASVPEALSGAVEIAFSAWNKRAWKDLIKNMP